MAGAIVIASEQIWMASNSPFRWVVDYLLEKLGDGTAKDEIKSVADHGFDTLDLDNADQFTPTDRVEILRVLRDHLVADAERRLPSDLGGRDEYLRTLAELAEQAGRQLSA
jgi:hypothetical protein